jgi:hypothetical protein
MRRILVDSARRNGQHKRGGDQERVEPCETRIAAPVEDEKLLQVHEALKALAREDPMKAEVKMRLFRRTQASRDRPRAWRQRANDSGTAAWPESGFSS